MIATLELTPLTKLTKDLKSASKLLSKDSKENKEDTMTEERTPYTAGVTRLLGLTPEEMEQETQAVITKVVEEIAEIKRGNDMDKCRRLVGDVMVYATTGICPRCPNKTTDADILAILAGVTLYCIVCGRETIYSLTP